MPGEEGSWLRNGIHRATQIGHPAAERRPEAEPPAAPQLCQMAGAECMAAPVPVRVQLKDWRIAAFSMEAWPVFSRGHSPAKGGSRTHAAKSGLEQSNLSNGSRCMGFIRDFFDR